MELILEPFQYAFMVRALVAGLVVGTVAPLLGQFMVVRRYSLFPDTLSHVALFGVAVALSLGVQPVVGAL
ncbi:MAG: metal ABC transporter permease, partial [Candidatus Roizmanbacteria bacterium]|nr:metal ABC transporter permease [Candidatus Roizmanbacteria bacterium]